MKKKSGIEIPEELHKVLLHACCAPCSSAIVEWLLQHDIHPTIFYFNPNIYPHKEYDIRKNESKRHAESLASHGLTVTTTTKHGSSKYMGSNTSPNAVPVASNASVSASPPQPSKLSSSVSPTLPPPSPPPVGRVLTRSTKLVSKPKKPSTITINHHLFSGDKTGAKADSKTVATNSSENSNSTTNNTAAANLASVPKHLLLATRIKNYKLYIMRLFCFLLTLVSCISMNAQNHSWTADNGNGTFTNPLFYDEFSDPDILRVGDDYYLAGTTMHTVPGLVILHSKDLVNWENISYCFDQFDFPEDRFSLKNHQEIYGQGIWAPCIRYANGQFYVFSNVNGKGLQCYTAKDIKGPWEHHNMKGDIYDLGVLFDDDGKIYAIHKYGEVHCTELKPDMSGPVEGTERVIIPEGNGVGEGHHMYKINGMYYLISTDYSPNGRTLCSRSKSIWGPYETRVIQADETYGYHGAGRTTVPRGTKYRIGEDGTKFGVSPASPDATGCDNAHQGGIVQFNDGSWWALMMQDFHSIGRTVCLMPITWVDGWPMIGLKGNLGRAPRTWFKPGTAMGHYGIGQQAETPRAPYERSENFNGKLLGRIWQWNHNPDNNMWSLKSGRLRLNSMPSEQLMWARNTLTQRVIGPKSVATVELYVKGMKDGDVAGLGNINLPCSWIGIVKDGNTTTLRCFEQFTNDTINATVALPNGKIWLRCIGNYDNDQAQYAYSTDGVNFQTLGRMMPLTYQLITFQGSRHALFAFNVKGKNGGFAEFDNFTVEEPMADRSKDIPYGKTIRIINKATDRPAIALKHGVLYDTNPNDKSELTKFRVIDRGAGMVALQCADGRFVKVYGEGLPGDVRFTDKLNTEDLPSIDERFSTEFLWQDYLDHDFMLFSIKNNRYLGKSPTTGSPYSMDFVGPDPARKNGSVFRWEIVEE